MNTKTIDYGLVANVIKQYESYGYKYVDVPWYVSYETISLTMPKDRKSYTLEPHQHLVGSAEQSFLQLIRDGELCPGRYIAATPCFRDEVEDAFHKRAFFKIELIDWSWNSIGTYAVKAKMLADACCVFSNISGKLPDIVETDEGYDICFNGIEVGSYGVRSNGEFTWMYGTGLALPRFFQAVNHVR